MLLYHTIKTRPDIAFEASQVCCISSAHKKQHAAVIKTIVHFLEGTKTVFACQLKNIISKCSRLIQNCNKLTT